VSAGPGRLFHAIRKGGQKGINPGPHILEIHHQHIDAFHHFHRRDPGFAVKAENRDFQPRIDDVVRFDHVILFFSIKSVLRGKQGRQQSGKSSMDQIPGMPVIRVYGCGVAQQAKPLAADTGRRGIYQLLESSGHCRHKGSRFFQIYCFEMSILSGLGRLFCGNLPRRESPPLLMRLGFIIFMSEYSYISRKHSNSCHKSRGFINAKHKLSQNCQNLMNF